MAALIDREQFFHPLGELSLFFEGKIGRVELRALYTGREIPHCAGMRYGRQE